MRRTKILATLGPASSKAEVIDAMISAGLDAVRLNFSHGTHEQHAHNFRLVRDASARAGRPVAVLQDLQGPKIRIGKVADGGIDVPTGSTLVITTKNIEGKPGKVSTEYQALASDVRPGLTILFDEGRVEVVVREVRGDEIVTEVTDGGRLSSHKGISVPGATLTAAAMTEKDRLDVRFGLELGVDLVALSFVRRGADVEELRALMRDAGRVVPIVAKIEKPQAIEALDEIIAASDGVMVARGDLGIEVSLERIPVYQKRIIARANRAGKLVITATQMLESMTDNPIPTRAEVTDVANAVLDGTDAVMLSGETAVGKHPVETVRRMAAIADTTEEELYPFDRAVRPAELDPTDFAAAAARVAVQAAHHVQARVVVVFTKSGRTAMLVSDERPKAPVLAFTADPHMRSTLALYWGLLPRPIEALGPVAELVARAEREIAELRLARAGDAVIYVLGTDASPDAANAVRIARL